MGYALKSENSTGWQSAALNIRDADDADMEAIQAIYAHYVLTSPATFEEVPPSVPEMKMRRANVLAAGLPFLVAENEGQVIGFCYASPYRSRSAYKYTVEDSIYVSDAFGGRGVGSALLSHLIARCEAGPWRQMLAVMGTGRNEACIALHRSLGFSNVGTLKAVGLKFGQWEDTVMMQRHLGEGEWSLPRE
ncbi:MAG: GNAT family N-acetyltransferase [Hyphomonas sp. 34-62-18]|nr:GNAT family N-acetyltransferase [Hyphomonas sp. 34-62-18]OZB16240.1 MAG: GNAT family N-acetyltransferase [Hyphomonas sp. 34-62-18]